ncbi:hypothetical protein LTR53_002628 [Teratosphaeriaceae sp. CCFEE 6253]|nr:hypothetical protein LTR53_002628 [Teratosphaeriaceae sp. CCFEE 6253]
MVTNVDLRVHAGAPSSRRDDDRRRALAEGYLGFGGARVLTLNDVPGSTSSLRAAQEAHDANATDVSLDIMQHTPGIGELERYVPSTHCQVPHPASPRAEDVDDHTSILHYDETTFVEGTQLAYEALESQLLTSSLTFSEVTPLKRPPPDDLDEGSPWPEDLDGGSFQKVQLSPAVSVHVTKTVSTSALTVESGDESFGRIVVPLAHCKENDAVENQGAEAFERPGKKPRLQRRIPAAPVFKPFRPPLRRAHTDVASLATPTARTVVPEAKRPDSSPMEVGFSQSSYLKTPVLVTPKQPLRQGGGQEAAAAVQLQQITEHAKPDDPGSHGGDPSVLPDYRERTPHSKPRAPFMPLPEGSAIGLAYIGELREPPHTPAIEQAHSLVSGSTPETTSELPTSYSLSDITSESSKAKLRASQRSASEVGHLRDGLEVPLGEALPENDTIRHGSYEPASALRLNIERQPADSLNGILFPSHADVASAQPLPDCDVLVLPLASDPVRPATDAADTVHPTLRQTGHQASPREAAWSSSDSSFVNLPLTIRPPEPPVSLNSFVTHITPDLSMLADQLILSERYVPILTTRDLRPLERGYWLIETSSWPRELQSTFWAFLVSTVGIGKAGWGVWCLREHAHQSALGLGNVKVFCWGEVVAHVYLMLSPPAAPVTRAAVERRSIGAAQECSQGRALLTPNTKLSKRGLRMGDQVRPIRRRQLLVDNISS